MPKQPLKRRGARTRARGRGPRATRPITRAAGRAASDAHLLRVASVPVAVSEGHVVAVGRPTGRCCPLARRLNRSLRPGPGVRRVARGAAARAATEQKIRLFGFFGPSRSFDFPAVAVPFGASEILRAALERGAIDAAVTVCDGAGTVITADAEMVQGIGARMNGLIFTLPIRPTQAALQARGCIVPRADATIDQLGGVREALRRGWRRIAVTVNGYAGEALAELRRLERERGAALVIAVVCTTGVGRRRAAEIARHADLVWGCGSAEIRRTCGRRAMLQMTTGIPVFVMSHKGLNVAAAYAERPQALAGLDPRRQYLLASTPGGEALRLGRMRLHLRPERLPVAPARASRRCRSS